MQQKQQQPPIVQESNILLAAKETVNIGFRAKRTIFVVKVCFFLLLVSFVVDFVVFGGRSWLEI